MWSEQSGVVRLGPTPENGNPFRTHDVSADGSVIVGAALLNNQFSALIWDAEHGSRHLQHVLNNDYGLGEDLRQWNLLEARGVSLDGRTIVGVGRHNGRNEGWIAFLGTPVPEPNSAFLAVLSLVALLAVRSGVQ
jgi:hypothetical protein